MIVLGTASRLTPTPRELICWALRKGSWELTLKDKEAIAAQVTQQQRRSSSPSNPRKILLEVFPYSYSSEDEIAIRVLGREP